MTARKGAPRTARRGSARTFVLAVVFALLAGPRATLAQFANVQTAEASRESLIPVDPDYEAKRRLAEIRPQLGEAIAKEARFVDELGRAVRIGDYFTGEQPVVVTLTYYTCPMMCNLVMNGVVEAFKGLEWTAGSDFVFLNVSIDPRDGPAESALRKKGAVSIYGRQGAEAGWHFLTGEDSEIRMVAESLGFGYGWDDEKQEFAHGAGLFLLTPDGRTARVLEGVNFADNLRLALLDAGNGKIGSKIDNFIFMCWQWDPEVGKYVPFAVNVMRISGVLTVLALAGFVFFLSRSRGAHDRETTPNEIGTQP